MNRFGRHFDKITGERVDYFYDPAITNKDSGVIIRGAVAILADEMFGLSLDELINMDGLHYKFLSQFQHIASRSPTEFLDFVCESIENGIFNDDPRTWKYPLPNFAVKYWEEKSGESFDIVLKLIAPRFQHVGDYDPDSGDVRPDENDLRDLLCEAIAAYIIAIKGRENLP